MESYNIVPFRRTIISCFVVASDPIIKEVLLITDSLSDDVTEACLLCWQSYIVVVVAAVVVVVVVAAVARRHITK